MKLNLFCPPVKSGSGEFRFFERILPVIAAEASVTLWSQSVSVFSTFKQYAGVRKFTPGTFDWRELNYADFNLYFIGNDEPLYRAIVDIARSVPGIVIMLEESVHGLVYSMLMKRSSGAREYLSLMEEFGESAVISARLLLEGKKSVEDISKEYSLFPWASRGALGAVVRDLEPMRSTDTLAGLPVLEIPFPWHESRRIPAVRNRSLEEGEKLIVVMEPCSSQVAGGHRSDVCMVIDALGAYSKRDRIELHICGYGRYDVSIRRAISRNGLGRKNVFFHSSIFDSRTTPLLHGAHMALNLSVFGTGTDCKALEMRLRYWEESLPVIAALNKQNKKLDSGTLMMVDLENLEEGLHFYWDQGILSYEQVAEFGVLGHETLIKRHGGELFTQSLAEFFKIIKTRQGSMFASDLARRAGRAIAGLQLGDDYFKETLARRAAGQVALMSGITGEGA